MAEKRKPTVIWIAITLACLTGYVLSSGPVNWLQVHGYFPLALRRVVVAIYRPQTYIYHNGPMPVHDALRWYLDLWVQDSLDQSAAATIRLNRKPPR
ncbi:MAG: hypothetical protein JWN70_6210 [Planctomycetaceae bacterium]|nr:hypothetical protein [Planctomycetaceae bacterium]